MSEKKKKRLSAGFKPTHGPLGERYRMKLLMFNVEDNTSKSSILFPFRLPFASARTLSYSCSCETNINTHCLSGKQSSQVWQGMAVVLA
ncbi:hypothetical protein CY34DRAFT_661764 [Suillus luteus UH-Slu-Lm8-n1]|uniref:Uncharacterized protein n=1 Tax=Suillus luteus UH-Slu-Lm8-n1 TaxID=930992 RepID=A0A0D0A7F1_9AGAM|nr:hypothetical protein CY34DRAFT_661764 [Suillus luteus UH-Slu-Lm8-n1]